VVSEDARAGLTRHVLPAEWFAALSAGFSSPAITRKFWQTERSRRLLLISALLDEAERQPEVLGPLPSAAQAWDTLAAAQIAAPTEVDAVLLHPQVGSWAAYALRRHRGGAASSAPLWIDFGGIHTLALVAAARAGLSWRTRIPLRTGHAMLPTLGMARFPDVVSAGVAEAETDRGRIRLRSGDQYINVPDDPTTDSTDWWALRRVRVGDELALTVWLDDVDPFRDLADPVPPMRLDQIEFERWESTLADAWALLCQDHRSDAEALADGVISLVPLSFEEGWETRSASTGEAFGSVMMSPPPDAVTLAVSLIHEFQHIKLGALMHLLQLTGDDDGALYYAPWRDDPRPLGGLLQGVYAFLGIAGFWRRHHGTVAGAHAALAAFEYACARGQSNEALHLIRASPALTRDGHELVDGLIARITPWLSEPLPSEIVRLSRLTADSHRTGWRLRHLHPEPGEVLELAKAWLAGGPPEAGSAPATLHPHPDLRSRQRIPALARRRVVAIGRGEAGDGSRATRTSATTLASADAALVAGEFSAAGDDYLAAIANCHPAASPESLHAWTGLALAVASGGPGPAAAALRSRPDLVRAVHCEVGAIGTPPDPVQLATWLAAVLSNEPV
jgi:HEXXH motif-containing protein